MPRLFISACNRFRPPSVLISVKTTDGDLFWKLLEVEHPRAEAFCRRLAGSLPDGDDLYQDALLAAMKKFERLRDKAAFKPWLYKIIINNYTSRRRAAWLKKRVSLTTEMAEDLVGDDPSELYSARRWLAIAMRRLSSEERALVTLFEIEGWSVTELASAQGKPEGTIKSRLFRARAKMRQEILKYLPEKRTEIQKDETRYALPQS
jgi:RNA polymerase sigma-70 factor (ECF subfamily)